MADFEQAFEITLGHEGGFSDDPDDPGGATRYGITESMARANGYTGEMDELPLEVAKEIYREEFWDHLNLGALEDQAVAEEMFDTAVNCGPGTAGGWLQIALNALNGRGKRWADISEDGIVGPKTIATANIATRAPKGSERLRKALNVQQGYHYISMARRDEKFERFLGGWLDNRVVI